MVEFWKSEPLSVIKVSLFSSFQVKLYRTKNDTNHLKGTSTSPLNSREWQTDHYLNSQRYSVYSSLNRGIINNFSVSSICPRKFTFPNHVAPLSNRLYIMEKFEEELEEKEPENTQLRCPWELMCASRRATIIYISPHLNQEPADKANTSFVQVPPLPSVPFLVCDFWFACTDTRNFLAVHFPMNVRAPMYSRCMHVGV